MTVINKEQKITEALEFNEPIFKSETYNGISIIVEQKTGKFNASQMCSDNHKKWRSFNKTKFWKGKLEAFKNSSFYRNEEDAQIRAPSILAKKGIKPEFQGEYIHPKLIHFVAEWCSDDYAFKVAELMDSINVAVHQRLNDLKLPDTPQNSNTVFNLIVDEEKDRLVSDNENKQCWGIRERDKFDYLDSWDKSWVKSEFEAFKKHLIDKLSLTYEELKRDYPQLID